jgi:hypothetical protein
MKTQLGAELTTGTGGIERTHPLLLLHCLTQLLIFSASFVRVAQHLHPLAKNQVQIEILK